MSWIDGDGFGFPLREYRVPFRVSRLCAPSLEDLRTGRLGVASLSGWNANIRDVHFIGLPDDSGL